MNKIELLEQSRNNKTIVKFGATWCGPCRLLQPVLDEIGKETDINVINIDIDENQSLATDFGVKGIPHLVYLKDGEQIADSTGVDNKDNILTRFE